jgi:hypothetical protein
MERQIEVSMENGFIIVSDGQRRYSFPASEPARNQYGYETGSTWAEEFEAGRLAAVTGLTIIDPTESSETSFRGGV